MHPNTINKSAKYCIREVKRLLALRETFPNIEIVWPNAQIDSYELLKTSDLVLSSGSTVALESMYLGRPTYHVDHSSYFHASSKTMIDYSMSIDELISAYSVKRNRKVALIEIALRLWHERLRVEPEDQVKGWNLFFSAISYRDVFRILNQAFTPTRKLTNKFIFGVGELFLLHLRSPDKT
jgi:predicted glycosyltransferase